MTFGFDLPIGLFALLSIIPLIILYLIRPKPVNLAIPSLMFFINRSKISKRNKILRHFQNELLFYIQLLILLFLAFAIAQPFISRIRDLVSDNKIFVLDVSASAQVLEGTKTRYDLAIEKITDAATTNTNTLILAKNVPLVALQNVGKGTLLTFLHNLKPSDEETNLGDAILLAGQLVQGKARVIVLSDFITTKGIAPERAKNTLEGQGIHVDFISTVLAQRNNIGIINLAIDDALTTVYVKNYENTPVSVPILVNDKPTTTLTIKPGDTEVTSFPTINGVSDIKLDVHDDFPVDNHAYTNTPDDPTINVLYITNQPSKFIQSALGADDHIHVTIAQPPIIPKDPYDIYLIQNVDVHTLLPGTFEDIEKTIHDKGGAVIIHAQDNSQFLNYNTFNIFTITNLTLGGDIIAQTNRLTKDIAFGAVKTMYNGNLHDKTITLASVNNTPLIALRDDGKGKIIYYGILESQSEFKINPDYPVFWTSLIKYLKGQNALSDINLKTGTTISNDNGDQLILDKIGIYNLPTGRIAVNLLNDQESAINPVTTAPIDITHYQLEPVKDTDKQSFQFILLILALALVLFEIIYTKIRGEV